MVSDTHIKKAEAGSRQNLRSLFRSRLVRIIFAANMIGLLVLIIGASSMNRFSQGLIAAKIDNVRSQAMLIASIMGERATGIGLTADLDIPSAKRIVERVELPELWRLRLHDKDGVLVADTTPDDDLIIVSPLDPIGGVVDVPPRWQGRLGQVQDRLQSFIHNLPWRVTYRESRRREFTQELERALLGEVMAGDFYDAADELVVSVTVPVRRVQHVVGVVTLESRDVEEIVEGERRALMPIMGLAFLVSLLSSLVLTLFVARPVRKLARASEQVTHSGELPETIPDLSRRRDEIGDLSLILRDMTQGLYDRISSIANFAADVAHEIKNPLTSLRSAAETLRSAKTPAQRNKLIDIIESDVGRMDRLISDISKASKMDATLAQDIAETVNVTDMINGLVIFYRQSRETQKGEAQKGAKVTFKTDFKGPVFIKGFELPFAQVLRNLIDNALTFSPPDGEVCVALETADTPAPANLRVTVSDNGPGIPEENLETIFERFYTERPQGAAFGVHSGLGLAICRQIVSAHDGRIWAENIYQNGQVPTGARFVIELPEAGADT